jgi:hypothetical protein
MMNKANHERGCLSTGENRGGTWRLQRFLVIETIAPIECLTLGMGYSEDVNRFIEHNEGQVIFTERFVKNHSPDIFVKGSV